MHGRLAIVPMPRNVPPGTKGRTLLRAHVVAEAKAQGIEVRYSRRAVRERG